MTTCTLRSAVEDEHTDPLAYLKSNGADVPGKTDALSQ